MTSLPSGPFTLDAFHDAPRAEVVDLLLACAAVPRWAEEIADARPFADTGALVTAARVAARPWTDDEVLAALARHPRLGERPSGDDAESAMSRREQAALGVPDEASDAPEGASPAVASVATVAEQLSDGNRRYEERFGHVFLLRAAGRSADEVLAILDRRLQNTPDVELRAAAANLREIAVLRLAELVGAPSHVTTHVLDAASGRPAAGVGVVLEALRAEAGGGHAGRGSGCWHGVATATTDDDGRVRDLGPAALHPGTYRVRFATGDWFAARDVDTFYPEVVVVFRVGAPDEPGAGHYHVPLLLSPFAYSTYRGS